METGLHMAAGGGDAGAQKLTHRSGRHRVVGEQEREGPVQMGLSLPSTRSCCLTGEQGTYLCRCSSCPCPWMRKPPRFLPPLLVST